jgi:hypothetical protein
MCDFGQIWLLFPALCMKRGKKDGAAGRKIEKRTRKTTTKMEKRIAGLYMFRRGKQW